MAFFQMIEKGVAGLLSVFAEFKRDLLRERVKWNLESAKRKGIRIGRPRTDLAKKKRIISLFETGFTKTEIKGKTGISRRSVEKILDIERQPPTKYF
jgi:DNA invertase Pin-like site-specific DNA recombinase